METPYNTPKELMFQHIVESVPNAIILVNKEGKIMYANSKSETLFGYTQPELMGQAVTLLIPARYHEKHPGFMDMFLKTPLVRPMGAGRELFALKKDGTEFPIEIGLNPIVTEDNTLVLASITDLTKRKKAEEKFRLVVESSPNALLLVNPEGIVTLINKQAEKLFGYEREELIGNKLEMLIPERFRAPHPGHRGVFSKNPQTRPMGTGRDLYVLRKDGAEIPVEIGLNPIEIDEGNMVLASIIDITIRKIQEATIKKHLSELEIKNKELEQFMYIASHDLQEPLRTVSNYLQILKEDYLKKLDEEALNHFSAIDSATKRMSALIRGLLDFSRIGKDKQLMYLDCRKIVEEVIADLGVLIKNSDAEIKIGEMPSLHVYETEMRQLFQNLISNAIKFQKKGQRPEIEIMSEKVNDRWKFSVRDNGIGIAPEYFERIFHIFKRLHSQAEYKGNGIGLAYCKKIVELHQGKIGVESVLGKGSTFYFIL